LTKEKKKRSIEALEGIKSYNYEEDSAYSACKTPVLASRFGKQAVNKIAVLDHLKMRICIHNIHFPKKQVPNISSRPYKGLLKAAKKTSKFGKNTDSGALDAEETSLN
jgi:hypothetical protein